MDVDDQLWARCRAGDASALGDLFRLHARPIHAHAFRLVRDWSRADDVLSTTFLEAWRRRDADVPSGMVLPWLYGIATNVARNERRGRSRAAALAARAASDPAPVHHLDEEAIAQRLDDEERAARLLPVVRKLPRRERELVALCWWSGLTYEEAAIALEVPVGTVRSRLSRARSRIERLNAQAANPVVANKGGEPR